jgi:hypothetical protein
MRYIRNLYVYSDIVEYQFEGNEHAPLLRIFPTSDLVKGLNFTS